jgi:hypothetical protein
MKLLSVEKLLTGKFCSTIELTLSAIVACCVVESTVPTLKITEHSVHDCGVVPQFTVGSGLQRLIRDLKPSKSPFWINGVPPDGNQSDGSCKTRGGPGLTIDTVPGVEENLGAKGLAPLVLSSPLVMSHVYIVRQSGGEFTVPGLAVFVAAQPVDRLPPFTNFSENDFPCLAVVFLISDAM